MHFKNIKYPLDGGIANITSKLCLLSLCAMDLTTDVTIGKFAPVKTN